MTLQRNQRPPTRREFTLSALSGTAAAVLGACGDAGGSDSEPASSTSAGSSGDDPSTSTTLPTTSAGSSSEPHTATTDTTDGTTDTTGNACGPASAWATGGTAAMTMTHCYPDPFTGNIGACPLICETTAGPCTAEAPVRQDVSEGFPGLPVRLALRVVAATTCTPLANARVEIWHTQRTGVYSGITPSPAFCYGPDPSAANHLYFRGAQTTDTDGRVTFDTCFPGWYPGRAIHIHFRVYLDNNLHATSQLFFADSLNTEIFSEHPEYQEFGLPNRTNITDGIIGKTDPANYVCTTSRMPDGAMLAAKVLAIRPSLGQPTCNI